MRRTNSKKEEHFLKIRINHNGFLIECNRDLWHHAHHKMPKQIIVCVYVCGKTRANVNVKHEPVMWFESDINFTRKRRRLQIYIDRDMVPFSFDAKRREKKMVITFKLASLLLPHHRSDRFGCLLLSEEHTMWNSLTWLFSYLPLFAYEKKMMSERYKQGLVKDDLRKVRKLKYY